MKRSINSVLSPIFYLIGIIIIFIIIEILYLSDPSFYPSLISILGSINDLIIDSKFYLAIGRFFLTIVITISISFIISILILLISEKLPAIDRLLSPMISVMKSIPVVVVTLLIWLLTDSKMGPYLVCFVAGFPIIYEGLKNSFSSIDSNIIRASLIDGTTSFNRVMKIKLPMNKNNLIMVFLQSIGIACKVIITSEYIYQVKNSVGYFIKFSYDYSLMSELFAWGIILTVFIIIIEESIKRLKNKYI